MAVAEKARIPRRVQVIAEVLRRFSQEELAQLVRLVPALEDTALQQVISTHFRQRMLEMRGGIAPSLEEEFLGGLTYGEYLKLSEEEEKAFWDRIFAEGGLEIDQIEEHDVDPGVRIPAGQKRAA